MPSTRSGLIAGPAALRGRTEDVRHADTSCNAHARAQRGVPVVDHPGGLKAALTYAEHMMFNNAHAARRASRQFSWPRRAVSPPRGAFGAAPDPPIKPLIKSPQLYPRATLPKTPRKRHQNALNIPHGQFACGRALGSATEPPRQTHPHSPTGTSPKTPHQNADVEGPTWPIRMRPRAQLCYENPSSNIVSSPHGHLSRNPIKTHA